MITTILWLSVVATNPTGLERESQIVTPSGVMERWTNPENELEYGVRLTRANGAIEGLEKPQVEFQMLDDNRVVRTYREVMKSTTAGVGFEEVFAVDEHGVERSLGLSRRTFHSRCAASATAAVRSPTALEKTATFQFYKGLNCQPNLQPLPETPYFHVTGREGQNWLSCSKLLPMFCVWGTDTLEEKTQASALFFLDSARKFVGDLGIKVQSKPIEVRAWSSNSDHSSYLADARLLFLGGGNFLDALDGFVVTHEWGHSVMDDINRGLVGYDATVIHEAVADAFAGMRFRSACIAPYDAKETEGQECLRDLKVLKVFPTDVQGLDPHEDSLVLSAAFWELRKKISDPLMMATLAEASMRIPKDATIPLFWAKFETVAARLIEERRMKTDLMDWIRETAQDRGLN